MEFDSTAYFHAAYSRHGIMNPLGDRRLLDAAGHCGLHSGSRILDIGSGNGWASFLLSRQWGCHATFVDPSPVWTQKAAALFSNNGIENRVELHQLEATDYSYEIESFDLVLCLGTTPVYGGFRQAILSLLPALAPGGMLLIGEPTIDSTPPKRYSNFLAEWGWNVLSISKVLKECDQLGLELLYSVRSTHEEWDNYMNLQWLAIIENARFNPGDEQAQDFLDWMRDEQEVYLRFQRHHMDWNLLLLRPLQR